MPRILKQKAITVEDLQKGVEFEVDESEINISCESEEEFDDEGFDTFKTSMVDVNGISKPRFLGGTEIPFHQLKENMTPITEDGLVLKEVIRSGVGLPIPEKSIVMMHYDAYIEGRKEQFDSTRLRNRPYKFLMGSGSVIPGLELGIESMKKEEIARFIISPEYAYGTMGCPPRIPANAEILYEVEIMNFHLSKDVIEFEALSPEEQKMATFEKILGVYQCENQMANDLFHQKSYKPAIARYRRAVKLLEDVSVKDEEDDNKRNSCLLKLYLNLAQCYNNADMPKQGMTYAHLALRLDPQNVKGLYRKGLSFFLMNDLQSAETVLIRAKQISPNDRTINNLLLKLEKKRKNQLDWEHMFCKKMMGTSITVNDSRPNTLQEPQEFIDAIKDKLKEFVESNQKELEFSPGYTDSQLEVVKALASELNLAFVSKIQNERRINKVAKRSSS